MFLLSTKVATIISIIWLFNFYAFQFTPVKKIIKPDDGSWWLTNSNWASFTNYPNSRGADHHTTMITTNKHHHKDHCKLVHVFAYFRHGTRYPKRIYLQQYLDLATRVKSAFCKRVDNSNSVLLPRFCEPYETPNEYKSSALLSEVGKEELKNIGSRLKKIIFPDPVDIDVRSSKSKRVRESAIQFFRGFNPNFKPDQTNHDQLIRYYRSQKRQLQTQNDFLNSIHWNKTLTKFSEFLGFTVTTEDVMNIFGACALGKANHLKDEMLMWCSMIPKDTLDAILYAKDVEEYWTLAAYPQNMSDPIFSFFQNILTNLSQQVKSGETVKPKITLLFGHHTGVAHLIKRLKLFQQNDPLNAANYIDNVNNRGLNLSLIIPMAANLQLHVHLCNNQLFYEPFLNEVSMLHKVDCKGKNSFIGCPASSFSSHVNL